MAVRSAIIKKAQRKIVQGASDGFWINEEWNDYFHVACEMLHREIVDSGLGYFVVSGTTLTKGTTDDLYALPSDFFALRWLRDADGAIYERNPMEEYEDELGGYTIENGSIRLVNYDDPPATLTLDYYRTIKEIGDWDGSDDSTSGTTYSQYAPLDTASAARVLSEIICVLAKAKDEALTPDQNAVMERMVSQFVERLGTRVQQETLLMGLD